MDALPGIGASILISVAASASFISFSSDRTLFTLTPCSGWSSYLVIDGPTLQFVMVTFTPKLSRVDFSVIAVSLTKASPVLLYAERQPDFRSFIGGNTYFFFTSLVFSISDLIS